MRTKRQKTEHQGPLTAPEKKLRDVMFACPSHYFTTKEVCRITRSISGRDKIRKLKASGIPIGPAKLLRTNDNGTRVYGWRMK